MGKLSPELLVSRYIKSATKGRNVSIRTRRFLTLVLLPIWAMGLLWSLIAFYYGCLDTILYFNLSPADNFGNYVVFDEYLLCIMAIPIYLCICFILPWVVVRLIFWIVDADKAHE